MSATSPITIPTTPMYAATPSRVAPAAHGSDHHGRGRKRAEEAADRARHDLRRVSHQDSQPEPGEGPEADRDTDTCLVDRQESGEDHPVPSASPRVTPIEYQLPTRPPV